MDPTRSLARGLALIELLAACPAGCSFRSLTRHFQLPNVTISRLLRGLEALGYVRHDAMDGLYKPGDRLGWLGAQEDAERHLRRIAGPFLRRLPRVAEGGSLLIRWTGRHAICIDRCGELRPWPYQEAGHVTYDLLHLPWGLFMAEATAYAHSDATVRAWRRRELARLAREGWAACTDPDRRRLAAPLRDGTGTVLGALVLVGPASAIDPQITMLGRQLTQAARACCSALVR